jgi:MoaA/NifB/PqqE/SkfB family radical SAM enzyme
MALRQGKHMTNHVSIKNVDLKVGFTCNNDCFHCVITDKKCAGDLSFEDLCDEIRFYVERYKFIHLILTGGEFTIRSDWESILDFIDEYKRQGNILSCHLQTNGRELSKKKKAARFLKTIDIFLIAIHGHNSEIHDAITRRKGSFNQTCKGIANLVDLGDAQIYSQTVISRINFLFLEKTFRFINKKLKITQGNLTFPHPNGNACSTDVVPTYFDVREQVNKVVEYALRNDFTLNIEMIPMCVFEKKFHRKLFSRLHSFCQDVVGTDASQPGESRVDYNALLKDQYLKFLFCAHCKYNESCPGVWVEYNYFYQGFGLEPVRC